jgi:transposase
VELVRLYSNLSAEADHLRRVRSAASSPRPVDGHERPRQHQRRLSMTEVTKLVSAYEQQASVKELAQQFGIHRTTVTALLQRHGVELRHSGLEPAEVQAAANLYRQGWTLARLGETFGADSTTIWRVLRAAGVKMRPRPPQASPRELAQRFGVHRTNGQFTTATARS